MKNEKKDFMILDDSDFKILVLLIRRSAEFSKLESIDQKILVWYLTHSPIQLKSWIERLSDDYRTSFSSEKLFNEIKHLLKKSD